MYSDHFDHAAFLLNLVGSEHLRATSFFPFSHRSWKIFLWNFLGRKKISFWINYKCIIDNVFYRQICFHSRYHRKFLCMWRAYYHFCTKTKLLYILNVSLSLKYLYLSFYIFRIIVLFDIKFFPNSSSNIFYKVSIKTFTYCFCKFLTFKGLKIFKIQLTKQSIWSRVGAGLKKCVPGYARLHKNVAKTGFRLRSVTQ